MLEPLNNTCVYTRPHSKSDASFFLSKLNLGKSTSNITLDINWEEIAFYPKPSQSRPSIWIQEVSYLWFVFYQKEIWSKPNHRLPPYRVCTWFGLRTRFWICSPEDILQQLFPVTWSYFMIFSWSNSPSAMVNSSIGKC